MRAVHRRPDAGGQALQNVAFNTGSLFLSVYDFGDRCRVRLRVGAVGHYVGDGRATSGTPSSCRPYVVARTSFATYETKYQDCR